MEHLGYLSCSERRLRLDQIEVGIGFLWGTSGTRASLPCAGRIGRATCVVAIGIGLRIKMRTRDEGQLSDCGVHVARHIGLDLAAIAVVDVLGAPAKCLQSRTVSVLTLLSSPLCVVGHPDC